MMLSLTALVTAPNSHLQACNVLPTVLSALHSNDPDLLLHSVRVTELMARLCNEDIRLLGGIPLLLSLIAQNRDDAVALSNSEAAASGSLSVRGMRRHMRHPSASSRSSQVGWRSMCWVARFPLAAASHSAPDLTTLPCSLLQCRVRRCYLYSLATIARSRVLLCRLRSAQR